jgi:hypothetical protein
MTSKTYSTEQRTFKLHIHNASVIDPKEKNKPKWANHFYVKASKNTRLKLKKTRHKMGLTLVLFFNPFAVSFKRGPALHPFATNLGRTLSLMNK